MDNKSNLLGVAQLTNDQRIIPVLNKDLKRRYSVFKDLDKLKSDPYTNLNQELNKYNKLGYLLVVQYLINTITNLKSDLFNVKLNPNLKFEEEFVIIEDDILRGDIEHINDLFIAADNGHLQIVQYLLNKGVNIHAQDIALKLAAQKGHLQVVKYLVNFKINSASQKPALLNPKVKPSDRGSALVNPPVNNLLNTKYKGVNIHVKDDFSLRIAATNGYLDVVKYLVSKGANIHAPGNDAALRGAAYNGHLQIVQYLISIGIDTNVLTTAQKLQFNIK